MTSALQINRLDRDNRTTLLKMTKWNVNSFKNRYKSSREKSLKTRDKIYNGQMISNNWKYSLLKWIHCFLSQKISHFAHFSFIIRISQIKMAKNLRLPKTENYSPKTKKLTIKQINVLCRASELSHLPEVTSRLPVHPELPVCLCNKSLSPPTLSSFTLSFT